MEYSAPENPQTQKRCNRKHKFVANKLHLTILRMCLPCHPPKSSTPVFAFTMQPAVCPSRWSIGDMMSGTRMATRSSVSDWSAAPRKASAAPVVIPCRGKMAGSNSTAPSPHGRRIRQAMAASSAGIAPASISGRAGSRRSRVASTVLAALHRPAGPPSFPCSAGSSNTRHGSSKRTAWTGGPVAGGRSSACPKENPGCPHHSPRSGGNSPPHPRLRVPNNSSAAEPP